MIKLVGMGGTLSASSRSLMALRYALDIAQTAGAHTKLYDLKDLRLPLYDPDQPYYNLPTSIVDYLSTIRQADALIISTGAYHGTIAGVTKNALDYLEYLADQGYLHQKAVGLIATASGTLAAANTVTALTHVAHALRTVTPVLVAIPDADEVFSADGQILVPRWSNRLYQMVQRTLELVTVKV